MRQGLALVGTNNSTTYIVFATTPRPFGEGSMTLAWGGDEIAEIAITLDHAVRLPRPLRRSAWCVSMRPSRPSRAAAFTSPASGDVGTSPVLPGSPPRYV